VSLDELLVLFHLAGFDGDGDEQGLATFRDGLNAQGYPPGGLETTNRGLVGERPCNRSGVPWDVCDGDADRALTLVVGARRVWGRARTNVDPPVVKAL